VAETLQPPPSPSLISLSLFFLPFSLSISLVCVRVDWSDRHLFIQLTFSRFFFSFILLISIYLFFRLSTLLSRSPTSFPFPLFLSRRCIDTQQEEHQCPGKEFGSDRHSNWIRLSRPRYFNIKIFSEKNLLAPRHGGTRGCR
jgi:hypothetical protein